MGLLLATAAGLTALAGGIYTNERRPALGTPCVAAEGAASQLDRATVVRSRPTKGHGGIWDHI